MTDVTARSGCGADVREIDLARASDDEIAAVRGALAEHGVVFFRDQSLTEGDHIRLAQRFGDINVNRFFAAHPHHPEIAMVAKEPDQTDNIGGGWHTDHSYDAEPAMGSILVARELPQTGGDTRFASMYAAYDALSDEMKERLDGLKAVHSARHIFGEGPESYYQESDAGGDRIGNASAAETLTDVVHPVVIRHPDSGKPALYVNPAFTLRFEGQTREESMPLLTELYAHCMKKDFMTQFDWKPGSIAFWDNRSTWHWALNDYAGQRRIMHRITLEGCALH